MLRRFTPAANAHGVDVSSARQPLSAPTIGELKAVVGSVTITRANAPIAQALAGDAIYQGDVIETGVDGLVSISLVDGSKLCLCPNALVVLDETICGAERKSGLPQRSNGRRSGGPDSDAESRRQRNTPL